MIVPPVVAQLRYLMRSCYCDRVHRMSNKGFVFGRVTPWRSEVAQMSSSPLDNFVRIAVTVWDSSSIVFSITCDSRSPSSAKTS